MENSIDSEGDREKFFALSTTLFKVEMKIVQLL